MLGTTILTKEQLLDLQTFDCAQAKLEKQKTGLPQTLNSNQL